MKIQTKTTLLFTLITSAFFIALNFIVYYFINKAAENDFNKRVELRAKISARFRFEKDHVSTEAFRELQREYLEKLPHEKAFILEPDSATGLYSQPQDAAFDKKYLQDIINANGATVYRQIKFRHYAGFLYKGESANHIIIKSATNEYGRELMNKLLHIKIATLIVFVIVISLAGHYFARRTFRPFRTIIGKVQQINENNLHLRLEEIKGEDEIAELVKTFNEMITRLEMAFETQNNFISNASHELRTPLTAISVESEYTLSKDREAEGYKQSIRQILSQANKLQDLIKGLLALAQTGFDGKKIAWGNIRLDQLVYDVIENATAFFPDNKINVSLENLPEDENRLIVNGSYDLLKTAILNILLNACKYSNKQPVSLQLSFEKNIALIVITDKGVGIPEEELKYIYDPFFRASNVQQFEGYGIGMPLSRNIIRLHKGKIEVSSAENKGTSVQVMLPLNN